MKFAEPSPSWRSLVAGSEVKIPLPDGRFVPAINLDNAATTPPFIQVLQAVNNFAPMYSSIHRGSGYKSQISSDILERARSVVADFVKADLTSQTVIFLKNTTEAINKLSYRLHNSGKKPLVLLSEMEHHSNILPWRKYQTDYIATDCSGRLCLEDLERKLKKYRGNVKLVAVTGASNVTGYITPIHTIAEIAHNHGAQILVDGAQLVPHCPVDLKPVGSAQHIDYLAFSAHKMYAPFGVGVLIGPRGTFAKGAPEYAGGGTVRIVTRESVLWDNPPHKEEAGTPNLMGVIALTAAIDVLMGLELAAIHRYESLLAEYAMGLLKTIPGIQVYCSQRPGEPKLGVIPINLSGVHQGILARILADQAGIAVREGCFCAQPYVRKLLGLPQGQTESLKTNIGARQPGMVRLSFGVHNLAWEVDILIKTLEHVAQHRTWYLRHYGQCQQ